MANPVNTGFDLAFGDPLKRFRDTLAAQGIQTNIIAGRRTDEDQRQLVANHLAGLQGQPLPYPDRGPVTGPVAPVGQSVHELGLAADVVPTNRANYARMAALAPQFGLQTIPNDPAHFQLADWRQAAANQQPPMPWSQAVAEAQRNRQQGNFPTQYASNVSSPPPPDSSGFTPPPAGTTTATGPSHAGTPTPIPGGSSHADFIRSYAQSIGLDPNLALGIANAEGLRAWGAGNPNAASRIDIDPKTGQPFSFGDFQLNIHPGAMGSQALAANIDPRDPTQWQAADKFALDQMKAGGVRPWKGDPVAKAYLASGNVPPLPAMPADGSAPAAPTVGAPPAPAGGVQGALAWANSDKGKEVLGNLDKTLGGKGLGKDAQQQQGGGPAQIQASPVIPGPGAHMVQPETIAQEMQGMQQPMGQTLNSMPELASAHQGQQGQQGGMSTAQAMAMLQQLAAQQAPQSQIQLPNTGYGYPSGYPGMYGYPGGGLV